MIGSVEKMVKREYIFMKKFQICMDEMKIKVKCMNEKKKKF